MKGQALPWAFVQRRDSGRARRPIGCAPDPRLGPRVLALPVWPFHGIASSDGGVTSVLLLPEPNDESPPVPSAIRLRERRETDRRRLPPAQLRLLAGFTRRFAVARR